MQLRRVTRGGEIKDRPQNHLVWEGKGHHGTAEQFLEELSEMLYVNAAELKCCESPDKMLVGKITKVQGVLILGIFLDSGCVWIECAACFSLIARSPPSRARCALDCVFW